MPITILNSGVKILIFITWRISDFALVSHSWITYWLWATHHSTKNPVVSILHWSAREREGKSYYAVIENDNCLVYNVLSRFLEQSAKQICFLYLSLGIHPSAFYGFRATASARVSMKTQDAANIREKKKTFAQERQKTIPKCRECTVTVGTNGNVNTLPLKYLQFTLSLE
jgi:hypothetical protein